MEVLKKVFGKNSTYLKVILLFYDHNGYFNNITGIANTLDVSHVTARKVICNLVGAGILREIDIGKSRVIKFNEGNPYAKALFSFLETVQSIKEETTIEEIIQKRSKESESKGGVSWG